MGHRSLGTNKQTACIDALIKCTHSLALLEARHQCSLSTPPLAPRMFQAAPTPMLHRKLWSLKQQCCICVAAALSSHNICLQLCSAIRHEHMCLPDSDHWLQWESNFYTLHFSCWIKLKTNMRKRTQPKLKHTSTPLLVSFLNHKYIFLRDLYRV